jgi:hypothetical protein
LNFAIKFLFSISTKVFQKMKKSEHKRNYYSKANQN